MHMATMYLQHTVYTNESQCFMDNTEGPTIHQLLTGSRFSHGNKLLLTSHFIIVSVAVDLKPNPGTLGVKLRHKSISL